MAKRSRVEKGHQAFALPFPSSSSPPREERRPKQIVVMSRQIAYETLNTLILRENWLIGKRIYEEELKGENRAEYGAKIIADLSKSLTLEFGRGFGKTNLYQFLPSISLIQTFSRRPENLIWNGANTPCSSPSSAPRPGSGTRTNASRNAGASASSKGTSSRSTTSASSSPESQ